MEGAWLSSLPAVLSRDEEMRTVRGWQELSAPWHVSRAKI
jgi:hypothetical protein